MTRQTPVFRAFSKLLWESRYVERLPGDPTKGNFTRQVPGAAYSEVAPTPVRSPKLIGWSERLAVELGIVRATPEDLEILAGNRVPAEMRPYAARYGGHQFGHWAGQLGDGRALTLGEAVTSRGRFEFQLKGAGKTPYSRRADGRAVLRSSLREFLCSEAMHFLGVPTTRALSLVATGEEVIRDLFYDGNPRPEPGAIVCRVSPSFLRFGNFEILAAHKELDLLKTLADLLIRDHFPEIDLSAGKEAYAQYIDEICRRTARMIVEWIRVGFVHGVMNTDNMSALGLTIDYGPYGWLEPYEPGWTPNTTDAEGRRYCFGNQPGIAQWNLARLCEAFYPLVEDEARLNASLDLYRSTFEEAYQRMTAAKLGIRSLQGPDDEKLVEDAFRLLQLEETDYTIFFRKLADWAPGGDFMQVTRPAFYSGEPQPTHAQEWKAWAQRYREKLGRDGSAEGEGAVERAQAMKRVNPKYVPRNYLAQTAIIAAEKGDTSVLERLMRVLERPYDEQPEEEELAARRPEWARSAPGCSALSCSS